MRSLRRAAFFVAVLASSLSFFAVACGNAETPHPPPAPSGPEGDSSVSLPDTAFPPPLDSGKADTSVPDATPDVGCVTGDGGAVVVSPASLSFGSGGLVNCGTQATPQVITVTNNSCSMFTWTGTLTSGASYYMLSPAMGMLAAGQSQMVQVVPAPIPQASAVTSDLYEGTVSITTTAPNDSGHIIQLHMTAQGVILASSLGGQTLAFGGVSIGTTASSQFSVSNNGNIATTASFGVGSTFFSVTGSFPIAANQSVAPSVTFKPMNTQMYTDTIIITVPTGTPLCGPLPMNTQITGIGTTGVAVSPTNLAFGLVKCGGVAAAYQTTTLTNTGANMHYTPTFALGVNSPYTLQDSTGAALTPGVPIALAAGGMATLRVVPNPISKPASTVADAFADTLTITTDSSGDAPHNVSLHETAQGAVFTMSPASIASSGMAGFQYFLPFSVSNIGNYSAGYTLSVSDNATPHYMSNLTGGTLSANTTENGILTVTAPPSMTQSTGTISLSPNAGDVLCADAPPNMPVSMTGQ